MQIYNKIYVNLNKFKLIYAPFFGINFLKKFEK